MEGEARLTAGHVHMCVTRIASFKVFFFRLNYFNNISNLINSSWCYNIVCITSTLFPSFYYSMLQLKCHESWELSGVAADRAHTQQSAFHVSLFLWARTAGARVKAGSPPNMAAPLPLRH